MRALQRLTRQTGVTLMELMITAVIIGIVAAMAVPRFSTAHDRMTIRSTNQNIKSAIQTARSMAIAEKAMFGVHFDNNNMIVTVFENAADSAGFSFDNGDPVVRADTLHSMFTMCKSDCSNDVIVFFPNGSCGFSGGGNIYTYAANDATIGIAALTVTPATGHIEMSTSYY